ncbi:LytTR family two component transcriptional regulator [Rhodococcus sp. OK611]|uniref:LytR/AlgR family response regulator transcription factor n=1 Tax=unclassified Rhodococcus (in: high G+C Gram-positive bacteria) TaxID=192944 RepID=UPI000BCC0FB0|nr:MULTISPECIES: LytTR family DNA-binding domain-containing protein [unclassified Rhodococcus (in: high G+C Gram-positive bacteria)]PTR36877.1 LytTR family two component transcriptional regulator [Rhodococcus sp. OK611]SNX93608.1 two component transcriptional regulator, LytTR family [Rhodococcus sp. OK270]
MTQNSDGPTIAPLTVLAVDDERPALDELAYLLRAQEAVGDILTASDATTALRVIKDRLGRSAAIDAVFLDINMPGLDGLELAGVLAAFADPPSVVFVTAHDDRAVAAFDLGAVDYLLKPLREERLAESVRRIVALKQQHERAGAGRLEPDADEVIPVELGGVTTLVPRSAVAWVEADGDYARLHTATGSHLVRIPISALESRWEQAGFLRVHRSYLVSLQLVTGIRSVGNGTVVCLRAVGDGPAVELPVSRRHTRELKDRLVRAPRQSWTAR